MLKINSFWKHAHISQKLNPPVECFWIQKSFVVRLYLYNLPFCHLISTFAVTDVIIEMGKDEFLPLPVPILSNDLTLELPPDSSPTEDVPKPAKRRKTQHPLKLNMVGF